MGHLIVFIIRMLLKQGGSNSDAAKAKAAAAQRTFAEQERTRRYYETLGLPQAVGGARAVKQMPPPLRMAAQRAASRALPPALPTAVQAKSFIESIELPHLAELKVPEVPAFHTASSIVSAISFETPSVDRPERLHVEERRKIGFSVHELIGSPGALKRAVILKEILGPPKGLQSSIGSSNFPAF